MPSGELRSGGSAVNPAPSAHGRNGGEAEASKRLRILVVIAQLQLGGAEKQVTLLARRLQRRGHSVEVAAFYPGGDYETELRSNGIPVHLVEKRSPIGLEVLVGLRRLIRGGSYDVVHSFLWPANWRARIAARLEGVPAVIISTRSYESHLGWHRLLANKILQPWTDLVVVNAGALQDHLVKDLGLAARKIRVVRNGIEPEPYRRLPPAGEVRERLGIPAGAPVLGSVGNFQPEKNQADMLRLMARLVQRIPGCRLLLAGGGDCWSDLRRLAGELGLSEAVIFIGPTRQVPECLAAMDLFLNTSLREGCCNAILEAMAASLPVLAYRVGGNPELVVEGETGHLFPPGGWEEMADCASDLLQDPERRRVLGQEARSRVETFFGVEEMVCRTERLYEEVLAGRKLVRPMIQSRQRSPSLDPASSSSDVLVTVIIPVRNEARYLRESLDAVLAQKMGADRFEVLVVDGLSTDSTRDIVRESMSRYPRLRLLDNPGRIVPTAMNLGLREARGEYIVRVDGHCIPGPDYLRTAVEVLRRTGSEGVGGTMAAVGSGFWGKAIAAATSTPFGVGDARFHYSEVEGEADTVYLGAYRRDYLLEIGGYDDAFVRNQDDELNYRIRSMGGKIYYTPRMRVAYHVRRSLPRLFRQYYQYGLWKVRMYRKTGHPWQIRHLVPSVFLLALLGPALVAPWVPAALFMSVAALALHLLAGSLWAFGSLGWSLASAGMPVVFLVIHLAYGVGFVAGIVPRPSPREGV